VKLLQRERQLDRHEQAVEHDQSPGGREVIEQTRARAGSPTARY
jgi:hypothetical protein